MAQFEHKTLMYKENTRSAAALLPSAFAEKLCIREEWSALKGIDNKHIRKGKKKHNNILKEHQKKTDIAVSSNDGMENLKFPKAVTSEVLYGVVALVEVGEESQALALRATLKALGATVVQAWSPHVTHLIWAQKGCRATRKKARLLACHVVSPQWVENCKTSGKHLPESMCPVTLRASDPRSPKTLRNMLKKMERDNVSPVNFLTDNSEDDAAKKWMTCETYTSVDDSRDIFSDESLDKPANTSCKRPDVATQKNTDLPSQRATTSRAVKPKRKLFSQREPDLSRNATDNETDTERTPATRRKSPALTCAKRMARRLAGAHARATRKHKTRTDEYKIVLTGMSRSEREAAYNAIRTLKGRVQARVNKRTTHVLLGSCIADGVSAREQSKQQNCLSNRHDLKTTNSSNRTAEFNNNAQGKELRTLNALLGAVRGCRVLYVKWAIDSLAEKRWLHHYEYEVPHLREISQKARVERQALGETHKEYAYDVFNGMRVHVTFGAEYRNAAITLLTLCGAVIPNSHDEIHNQAYDVAIGVGDDEVASKWVFDSVAAARVKNITRYIN